MVSFFKSLVFGLLVCGSAARKHMLDVQRAKELKILEQETSSTGVGGSLAPDHSPKIAPTVHWLNISLPIDYSGTYVGNFSNRYWIVDDYYEPGGPVMVFDTGESNGGDGYLGYMTRDTTFFNRYLQHFKGLGIVWEHRYYGQSKPFPINLNTTAEQLRFLTTENALKDFVVFAQSLQWKDLDISPKKAPWVVVGGSYPGMRAAMWRHLYPDVVYAAYASSAPVQAQMDMSIYFEQTYRGTVHYGYENCTQRIKLAVDYIDSQLDKGGPYAAEIKQRFLGRTAERGSNEGFADTLSMTFWGWQSGGVDDVIKGLCDRLDSAAPPPQLGLRGMQKFYADRWASYPRFVDVVNEYNPAGHCEGQVRNGTMPNCLLDERFDSDLGVSWTWQYCTEWGFFQPTNIGPHALGSKYNSMRHQQEICYRQFPDGLSSGYLPKTPNTDYINRVTDGWYMRPSNTFWTGGEFDPWRTLSPLSTEPWSPRFGVISETPACGVSTQQKEVFGYFLKEAEHCYDFRATDKALPATTLFQNALDGWLECFGK